MRASDTYTGDPEVDQLLFSWGRVIAEASGKMRGFALSIQKARQRPGWMPSPKQLALMRRLAGDAAVGPASIARGEWHPIDYGDVF